MLKRICQMFLKTWWRQITHCASSMQRATLGYTDVLFLRTVTCVSSFSWVVWNFFFFWLFTLGCLFYPPSELQPSIHPLLHMRMTKKFEKNSLWSFKTQATALFTHCKKSKIKKGPCWKKVTHASCMMRTNRPLWLHIKRNNHAVITQAVAAQPIKYVLILAGPLSWVPGPHMCVWGRVNLRLRSQERTTWV